MPLPADASPATAPRRRPLRGLLLLLVIAAVPVGAVVLYKLTIGRSPLAGPSAHDFGTVRFTGDKGTVEHVFDLTNRTSETIIILEVKPTCGCAGAELSSYMVDPGQTIRVAASLDVSRSGLFEEAIGLILKRGGVRVLRLRAVGRRDPPVAIPGDRVAVESGSATHLAYVVEVWGETDPAPPTFDHPASITVSMDFWRRSRPADPHAQRPAAWSGQAEVIWDGTPLPADATFTIHPADGTPLVLPLVEGSPHVSRQR